MHSLDLSPVRAAVGTLDTTATVKRDFLALVERLERRHRRRSGAFVMILLAAYNRARARLRETRQLRHLDLFGELIGRSDHHTGEVRANSFELAEHLGMRPQHVRAGMRELLRLDILERPKRGRYFLAPWLLAKPRPRPQGLATGGPGPRRRREPDPAQPSLV